MSHHQQQQHSAHPSRLSTTTCIICVTDAQQPWTRTPFCPAQSPPTHALPPVLVFPSNQHAGFTKPVAQWVTTNLRAAPGSGQLRWTFDLDGIAEMYDSYEDASMWELLQQPPQGLSVDFVRAERSSFRWEGEVVDNLTVLGHRVHLLKDAGHVVHQDNPSEWFRRQAAAGRLLNACSVSGLLGQLRRKPTP